jgi:plastocyanin
MRRPAVVVAGLAVVALALAPAAAVSQHGGEAAPVAVSIGFDAVAPPHVDVLEGDTVHWSNDSVRTHTVTADDGSFDSGRVVPTATYSRTFATVGDNAYHCVIHPFIRGDVRVNRLLLTAPAQPAASSRPFPLAGRTVLPAGTSITIEADRGAGFSPVTTTTAGADGSFSTSVVPGATATWRAVAGAETSPPVSVLVLDRSIAVSARRARRGVVIATSVTPASAGAQVVLQLFLPEHFGWWPVQRTKLDRGSRARFAVRLRRRVAARVLLTLPDGATPLATSRTLRVGSAR